MENKENKILSEDEKYGALDALLNKQSKKAEKKGYEMVVGRADNIDKQYSTIPIQPLGYPLFDKWSGGGSPRGGVVIFQGGESVGKTSFSLMLAAAYQRQGKTVLYVDYEHTFDAAWATKLGVDVSKLRLTVPQTLERGLDTIEQLVKEKETIIDAIILDSLDAAVPEGAINKKGSGNKHGADKDIDEDTIALKPRKLSQWFPRVQFHFRKHGTTLYIIAQQRTQLTNAGGFPGMAGGNALSHANLLNIKMSRANDKEDLVVDSKSLAYKMKLKVFKSKYEGLRKGNEMETYFFHDRGFNAAFEAVSLSLDGELENSPLSKSSPLSSLFVDKEGVEHKIAGGKPATVYSKMTEEGLMDEFLEMIGYGTSK